ncbi:DUF924 family protein [Sphingomonas sp.]
MSNDLGSANAEVHALAGDVLAFWFDEVSAEQRFVRDEALDARIAERFGDLRDDVYRSRAVAWRTTPDATFAAIILLDQFSRNIHRGTERAFEADPLALALAREMIAKGWDRQLPPDRRAFVYLPFMHSEDAGVQAESVALYEELGIEENRTFARDHADVIARFGRFPGRNAALGRDSSAEEADYLSQPGAGW